jgi:hypothetical protein
MKSFQYFQRNVLILHWRSAFRPNKPNEKVLQKTFYFKRKPVLRKIDQKYKTFSKCQTSLIERHR